MSASLPVCDIAKPGVFTYNYHTPDEYQRFLSIVTRDVQNDNCCAITIKNEIIFNKYKGETPAQEWTNKWIRDSFLKDIDQLLFLYNGNAEDYTIEIYVFKTESSKLKIDYTAATHTFRVEEFFSKEREAMVAKLLSKIYSVSKIQKALEVIRESDDGNLDDLEYYIELKRAMNKYDYALTSDSDISTLKMIDMFSDFIDQIMNRISDRRNPGSHEKYRSFFKRWGSLTKAIRNKCVELQHEWDDGGNEAFMESSNYFLSLLKNL